MGQVSSVCALAREVISDDSILDVINPTRAKRNRSEHLQIKEFNLPPHAKWRESTPIGAVLDGKDQIIRSNHFKVDIKGITRTMYQYAVHMYKYFDGRPDDIDCAAKEDARVAASLVLQVRDNHPEWRIGSGGKTKINICYIQYTIYI